MKAFQTALLTTALLLGTSVAYAEGEGNGRALVEKPAGRGLYVTYGTDGRGELIPMAPGSQGRAGAGDATDPASAVR